MVLLEEGPVHYSVWRHLPALSRDREHDGFRRDHVREDPSYAKVFHDATTYYSTPRPTDRTQKTDALHIPHVHCHPAPLPASSSPGKEADFLTLRVQPFCVLLHRTYYGKSNPFLYASQRTLVNLPRRL